MQQMKRLFIATAAMAMLAVIAQDSNAQVFGRRAIGAGAGGSNMTGAGTALMWASHSTWGDYWARNQANSQPWHGNYYYLKTGQPTALIVPPTVHMQQNYSWGVSQNTVTPVYHQFGPGAANGGGGGAFQATPYWPSHTNQFGVYPVRGPW